MRAYSGGAPPSQARKVVVGGLEHHVLEWDSPKKTTDSSANGDSNDAASATVLMLHGFMDVGASWELVAPALSAVGLRVLAPDLRGFGDAPRVGAGSSYVFADYIVDVAALVDALAPSGTLFVVGHSMGGVVATLYAGTFPDRVQKLVTLEGLGPPDNEFASAPDRMRDYVEGMRKHGRTAERSLTSLDEAVRRLAMNHPNVAESVLRARAPSLVNVLPDGRVTWRFDPLHRLRSPFPFYSGAFRAFASRITCPVLAISGGPTGYHPADEPDRLAAFRDLRVKELPEAGHMMHWTQPEPLTSLLVDFLQEERRD